MKSTILEIDQVLDRFADKINNTNDRTSFANSKEVLIAELKDLQLQDPVLVPYSLGNNIDDIICAISKAAELRNDLQMVYAGGGSYKLVKGIRVDYPLFTDLSKGFHVLIKPFDSNNIEEVNYAERTLNQYLLHVLLAYPRGSVRVNFIDPNLIGLGEAFLNISGGQDYSAFRMLRDECDINDCLTQEIPNRISDINRKGENFYVDNFKYEIFVMLNVPSSYQHITNNLESILHKGEKYGIQFVLLNDINVTKGAYDNYDILDREELFTLLDSCQEIPKSPTFCHYGVDLFYNDDVFKHCVKYITNGIKKDGDSQNKNGTFTPIPKIDNIIRPEQYFQQLREVTSRNVVLPYIEYSTYEPTVRGKFKIKLNQIQWQINGNRRKHIQIDYTWNSESHAINLLNQIVMNILLSLPITKVHVTLINDKKDSWARFLDKNIDDRIVDVIYDSDKVPFCYSSLTKKMEDDSNNLGCSLEDKNIKEGSIYRPYEIVVANASEAVNSGDFVSLIKNGADSGIYFIILNNKEEQSSYTQENNVINQTPFVFTIDADADLYKNISQDIIDKANVFSKDTDWAPAAVEYINSNSIVKVNHDWDTIVSTPYPETSPDMSVIIGYEQGTGIPVEFKLDISHSHYHSFVIGGTGSGKTTFLHNIIISLALKYKPEDLELYLIDLKGPEFGRYKQLQQVGAILVDKTDELITYEVIGNLVKEMHNRKELIAESGGDLAKYNKIHKQTPLSQILLIVDECQNLYKANSENINLARKIVDAITQIATEGRAFGIHLLMATQSLNNCPLLDAGVLTQFQDFYILPCVDTDAKMLVKAEHKEIVGQEADRMEREKEINRGQCFLQGTDGYKRFKFNFISDDKSSKEDKSQLDELIEKSIIKSEGHISNPKVFFSGRQNYSLFNNADCLLNSNNYLLGSAGKNISFSQDANLIYLTPDQGENILTIGYNDKHFVTRTSITTLLSLMLSSKKNGFGYRFLIINCLGQDGLEYTTLLNSLSDNGYCQLIDPNNSGNILKTLCNNIASKTVEPTVLTILSQEKYSFLKNNDNLPTSEDSMESSLLSDSFTLPDENDFQGTLSLMSNMNFGVSIQEDASLADVKTYQDALRYILQNGPSTDVHTIMQINKSSEFAISNKAGYSSTDKTDIYKLFKHLILLQTDKDTESFFGLYDLGLHDIQENENRLRAYYYKPDGGSYQLFSPYMLSTKKIEKGINKFEYVLDIETIIDKIINL